MPIALHQRHFRFGYDDGTQATHTWIGLEDAAVTVLTDVPFLLRIAVWEEGGTAAPNLAQQFQCRRNAGGWQNVTTTSTICKAVAVAAFTNGANCTQRLTAHGTFESSGAGCTEDGSSGGNANDLAANGSTETECGLQLVGADLASGDTIEFRLTVSGPTTAITYDVTPSLTVSKSSPSPSRSASASPSVSGSASLSPSATPSVSSSVSASASPSVSEPPGSVFGRPSSDVAAGSWTPSSGGDLHAMLSETVAVDTTYILSAADPVDDTCKLGITGLTSIGAGTVTVRLRGKWAEAT